jgi:hypothetical protein
MQHVRLDAVKRRQVTQDEATSNWSVARVHNLFCESAPDHLVFLFENIGVIAVRVVDCFRWRSESGNLFAELASARRTRA